ncbi:MAG TPA: biotin/lipoyl-binding protein, partial [Gemmata sp.]|nr:biotin/lipoyl-binding protein [Gemmata sp.]
MSSSNAASSPAPSVPTPADGALHQPSIPTSPEHHAVTSSTWHRVRYWVTIHLIVAALAIGIYFAIPVVQTALNTVSTDDAYVNGHVTFVAPRVSGQVKSVLTDDNKRVKAGQVIMELDPIPYQA